MLRALLLALLEPPAIGDAEKAGDHTARLALQEEAKTLPFGTVWDFYCESKSVPVGAAWLDEVRRYEKEVLSRRSCSLSAKEVGEGTLLHRPMVYPPFKTIQAK
jgi:L-rhamnose isomerase